MSQLIISKKCTISVFNEEVENLLLNFEEGELAFQGNPMSILFERQGEMVDLGSKFDENLKNVLTVEEVGLTNFSSVLANIEKPAKSNDSTMEIDEPNIGRYE